MTLGLKTLIFQGAVFIFEHISMFSDLAPQIYIKPQKKRSKITVHRSQRHLSIRRRFACLLS